MKPATHQFLHERFTVYHYTYLYKHGYLVKGRCYKYILFQRR
jgi:hypothetical protein